MAELGNRILKLRKEKNLSQTDLANKAGVSYAQIGRYETKGAQPPAEIINKIADALETTTDYLINGDKDEKAKATLKDSELLQQFKAVEQLNDKDKSTIKDIIDAFIKRNKIQQIAAL
ncbi:MAG: helix-turn-helix transcriptional regulator [Bacteroidota bacterium]